MFLNGILGNSALPVWRGPVMPKQLVTRIRGANMSSRQSKTPAKYKQYYLRLRCPHRLPPRSRISIIHMDPTSSQVQLLGTNFYILYWWRQWHPQSTLYSCEWCRFVYRFMIAIMIGYACIYLHLFTYVLFHENIILHNTYYIYLVSLNAPWLWFIQNTHYITYPVSGPRWIR